MKSYLILAYLLTICQCLQIQTIEQNIDPSLSATNVSIAAIYPQQNLQSSSKIYLRGDNCNLNWSKGIELTKVSANTWNINISCAVNVSVKISIKLLVNDTVWMLGANHVFTVNSTEVKVYPSFYPKINSIYDSSPILSSILGNSRKISIYYPPSYYDNTFKKYELLLLHDGQNLFDNSKAAFGVAWMVQNTTNTYIAQGKIREIIIVGIWNTNQRVNQYTYSYDPTEKQGGRGNYYLDFIEKQLMPKLNTQYLVGRIEEGKVSIGGSSLGGLISCYACYSRPKVYRSAICMSSSFWWNNQDFINIVIKQKPYNPATSLYIDSGDSGPSQDNKVSTDHAITALQSIGYIMSKNLYYYLDKGGQHSESYWGKRFYVPLTYLFSP